METYDKHDKRARHSLTIEQKENVSITGVLDVLSFDEENVIADTEMGVLIIKGAGLHVNKLNLDTGDLCVDGAVISAAYEDAAYMKGKGGLISRLFK
ncbi:MAG: sporulation protein YabP [Clostridiales bacterium]|jgi:sporulation protein YabP|nr:sporulation protein YabP [Clostridiales bacterium]